METYDDQLILKNVNLAYKLAWKYYLKFNKVYDIEELKSISILGLVKASKTYIRDKDVLFSTYAYTVIQNELRLYIRKNYKYINDISISATINENTDIEDILQSLDNIENKAEYQIYIDKLYKYIEKLNTKERLILKCILNGQSQQQIADKLHIHQSYISRIYNKILNKLKYMFRRDLGEK